MIAIDISKHRTEVLIGVPGKKRLDRAFLVGADHVVLPAFGSGEGR